MICSYKAHIMADFEQLITPSRQSIITLFNIVQMTNLSVEFLASFKKFIMDQSNKVFAAKKEPHELIADLIGFKLYCDELQTTLGTDQLKNSQKIAFEYFVNSPAV